MSENASMRVTRSRTRDMMSNKTGRGVLSDISDNPHQQKKQQTRKKTSTKAFTVASDPIVEDVEIDAMELSIVEEEVQEKPEWYTPDPQFVSDYMNDIMHCYRQSEGRGLPQHGYLSAHNDINEKMREILVDWLVEVHMKFNLQPAVLYTTVQLIDRFLGIQAVTRSKLQLVGITAMLISSKMEEIYPPEVKDFVYISDKAYTQEEIIQMEQTMLNTLKFQVAFPTVFMFTQQIKVATMCVETTSRVASFLMDMTLQERWIGYTEAELRDCMECVNDILEFPRELRAVRKKYTSSKWGKVALSVKPLLSDE